MDEPGAEALGAIVGEITAVQHGLPIGERDRLALLKIRGSAE
jgi:hypothetical protein